MTSSVPIAKFGQLRDTLSEWAADVRSLIGVVALMRSDAGRYVPRLMHAWSSRLTLPLASGA